MLKKIKIILWIIIIIVVGCVLARYFKYREHVIKLIVIDATENSIKTIDMSDTRYIVRLKKDGKKYKEGQEINVYFDGIVATGFPMEINADRIEIIKEKTDKEIPEEIYRYYNFSQKNISTEILNFTNTKMEFLINDENKYPLEYGEDFSYKILRKNVENEKYNENLEFDYDSYTPTTETTTSSYSPDPNRLKKVWEELEIIGEVNNENCKWEEVSEENLKLKGICDWTEMYGELEAGEYYIEVLRKRSDNDSFFRNIIVEFKVDASGNVKYENPEFGW